MQKRIHRTKEFCIGCSADELNRPYRLYFRGFVHYYEYPPNCSEFSDWDSRGYNEYLDVNFSYIVMETESEEEFFLEDSEVPPSDFEVFARKLNIRFGF